MFILFTQKKYEIKLQHKKNRTTTSTTVIQIYGFIMRNDAVLILIIATFAMCCENAR